MAPKKKSQKAQFLEEETVINRNKIGHWSLRSPCHEEETAIDQYKTGFWTIKTPCHEDDCGEDSGSHSA